MEEKVEAIIKDVELYTGNYLAHELDMSSKWLLKLFDIIEPNMKCENIAEKLSLEKADDIIMQSINNRKNNFKDKAKLEENEKVIFSTVSEKKIISILLK